MDEPQEKEVPELSVLREMLLIRLFEERVLELYSTREFSGFCHLCNGQEVISVATARAIDPRKDAVFTAYRDHGFALSLGLSPADVFAELLGKSNGCSRGKGGSMHLYNVQGAFYGGNGIVGAQIPHAVGMALAQRNRCTKGISLCFFGDGASAQGVLAESLNMAQLWKLPVIFICENNRYGMGTAIERAQAAAGNLGTLAAPYGIPYERWDAMNYSEFAQKLQKLVEQTRENPRPFFIEAMVYRYKGHSISDPASYRSAQELSDYQNRDPLLSLKEKLFKETILNQESYQILEDSLKKELTDALNFARKSPDPQKNELYQHVYTEDPYAKT